MSENTKTEKPEFPTPEQEKAINAEINSPTVVSAAAGAGKTTMLVARVLKLISDCAKPVPADSLAILTFTVNATQKLRDKLNKALTDQIEKLEDGAQRDYLADQIVRLRNASIATINSFCFGIIKDNIEKFDLPVNVAIADETKAASLQLAAIELTRHDFYDDEYFEPEERNLLFYSFNFEKDDDLFECVISAARSLSSYSDSEKWLDDAVKSYDSIENLERFYFPVFVEFVKKQYARAVYYQPPLKALLDEYSAYYDAFPEGKTKKAKEDKDKRLKARDSMKAYLDRLNMLIDTAAAFIAAPALGTLEKLSLCAQYLPAIDRADLQNPIKKAFTAAKAQIPSIFEALAKISVSKSEEELNLEHNRTVITAFVKLIKRYCDYYTNEKRAQGYIDFSDCELLLLDKLRNDADFREQLSARFSCVIVDEFQDCNDVQAEIFKLLGKERQFYVGDIKQSIYAFRGGNPEIMAGLCKKESGFDLLPLTQNFRSRQAVIDTVNDAFTGLMTEKYGGVDYNDDTKLVYGAKYPEKDDPRYKSEIYSINCGKENENKPIRAKFVAQRIDELMHDESFKITKDGKLCRPNYSDFVILVRKNSYIAEYRQALAQRGISSVAPHKKNILDSEEVRLLVDYLKVIDNLYNDNELLHVLMSPLYRLSAEKIARIKLGILGFPENIPEEAAKEISESIDNISCSMKNYGLYECLKFCTSTQEQRDNYGKTPVKKSKAKQTAEDEEKALAEKKIVREFDAQALAAQQDITNFRNFMRNNSVVDLIRKICSDTDIYAVVCALDNSRRRVANLHRFEKIAEEFVSRNGGTLCDFLRYIKQIEANKRASIEEASVPEDAANSVRIMTFHASKGLEFPICILAELQSKYSSRDYSGKFLMNHNYSFSINFVDRKARYRASTFAHSALGIVNKQKLIGEELRLLYVAMTRAQEKLIMVGSFPEENVPSLADDYYEGVISFKWVLRKLIQTGKYEITRITEFTEELYSDEAEDNEIEISEDELKQFEQLVEEDYRNEDETKQRAKYTVTEIAHMSEKPLFVRTNPSFAKESGKKDPDGSGGTEVGNAYHHTMEHIPLEKMQNTKDLNSAVMQAVKELSASGNISEEESHMVIIERIAEFFSGELGQRMLNSGKIEREFSFYVDISGDEINVPEIGANVLIQGQVDMLFEESDGIVIVDYKSDSEANFKKEKENYSLQVRIYAAAVSKLFGKPVKESYLYSFSSGKAVKVSSGEAVKV